MVTCQACGTANAPDASHCIKCARKLDEETQGAVVQQRAQHTATGVNWSSVLIAIVIILLLAAIIALLVTHVL